MKFISAKIVMDKVFRDHKYLRSEILWEDIIEWIDEFLRFAGVTQFHENKVCKITIEDYKGLLPLDMLYAIMFKDSQNKVLKYTGDPFFIKCHDENSPNLSCTSYNHTYQINDTYIHTSFQSGYVWIAYQALPLDSDNIPMIPEDESLIRALTWFIAWKIGWNLYMADKLEERKFNKLERNMELYKASAITNAKIPDLNRMEYWMKSLRLRLIPNINQHDNYFRWSPEEIWNHNTNNFDQGVQ